MRFGKPVLLKPCRAHKFQENLEISQTTARIISSRFSAPVKGKASPEAISATLKRQAGGRRFINFVLISGYLLLFAVVTFLVLSQSSQFGLNKSSTEVSRAAALSGQLPQDQLSSLMIAQTVANMTGIGEAIPVSNQAASARAELEQVALSDATLSAKPQVVQTNFTSYKGITIYKVKPGDTLSSIADKFGVSTNSIRWSNDIEGFSVSTGDKLRIPPINGIVYKVASGDTLASLAEDYDIAKSKIVRYNDAEIRGLTVGSWILLPGAIEETVPTYHPVVYGFNGYDPGWCTWYVASRINVPIGWGNANTWDYYAGMTPGWIVSDTPKVGAIAQHNRGWAGHVAVVEAVNGNMIKYSDMNGIAGFNNVGYSGWVPASHFDNYIYR